MSPNFATDAERAASVRCPECSASAEAEHARDCVLRRPALRYEDYRRWLRTNRPEEFWSGSELLDHQ
jgi:hypothetical protein